MASQSGLTLFTETSSATLEPWKTRLIQLGRDLWKRLVEAPLRANCSLIRLLEVMPQGARGAKPPRDFGAEARLGAVRR